MQNLNQEFIKIISSYQGIIHKVCLIYFRSKADREDNFQEILYQLWKSFPNLKSTDSLGSWIYAVSINTSIAKLRKDSRFDYREKLPDFPDANSTIDDFILDEELRLLLGAIYKLSEINKSIMLLYLDEKSYDEIALILGISKSNVGVRINRAKEILKNKLKNINHGD